MKYKLIVFVLFFSIPASFCTQESDQLHTGIELFQNRQYDKAKQFFQDILTGNQKNEIAKFYMGRIYYEEGDFESAVSFFDEAVHLSPKNSSYYFWLGKAYEGKLEQSNLLSMASLYSKMKASFKKAIEIDPDNVEARYELAKAYNNASSLIGGSKTKAHEQLEEIQKLDPLKGHELAAYFYWYEEKWTQAAQEYLKYLDADSSNAQVHYHLGICYLKTEKPRKAFESFQNAVKINSDLDRAHWHLGQLYLEKGDKELARIEFEKALEINPDEDTYKKALRNL